MNAKLAVQSLRYYLHSLANIGRRYAWPAGIAIPTAGLSSKMRFYLDRGYEAEEIALIDKHLSSTDAVLEIGASLGFVALYCIKKKNIDSYAMVEANPDLPSRIRDAFRVNKVAPRPLLVCAVGPSDGTASFGISKNSFSSSILVRPDEQDRQQVSQRSIPSLLNDLDFRPNVLIMDIEGGEALIPSSHFQFFDKIIIELHPHICGSDPIDNLISNLKSMGYIVGNQIGRVYYFSRAHLK